MAEVTLDRIQGAMSRQNDSCVVSSNPKKTKWWWHGGKAQFLASWNHWIDLLFKFTRTLSEAVHLVQRRTVLILDLARDLDESFISDTEISDATNTYTKELLGVGSFRV